MKEKLSKKQVNIIYHTIILCFIFLIVGLSSCKKELEMESELGELFLKEKTLNCLLESMKDSIKTEWDQITILLDKKLPEDMPSAEKANMLKVRNANLIRMFQSFEHVDDDVKVSLKETEKLDKEMSRRITSKKKEIQAIETIKMELFQRIEKERGNEELIRIKELHRKVLSETCK